MSVVLVADFFNNWPTPLNGVGVGLTVNAFNQTDFPSRPQDGTVPPTLATPIATGTTNASSTVSLTIASGVAAYLEVIDNAGKSWWFTIPAGWWGDGLTHYFTLRTQAKPSGQVGVSVVVGPTGNAGPQGPVGATGPAGPPYTVNQVTTNTTAQTQNAYEANASGGAFTITSAAVTSGFSFKVTKTDSSANAVTIALSSGTINGSASIQLTQQYQSVEIRCDGTNGYIN